jgi:dGTP triphosphohydrolase
MKFLQVLLLSTSLLGLVWIAWQLRGLKPLRALFKRDRSMPEVWPLARRPVLNARERHVYALMKQAFPQQQVLVKLPLTRFTQLRETKNAAFWYELLTPLTVSFTLCDGNTQVFAVVDLLNEDRAGSSATKLKRRALAAAQVRYVRLNMTEVPSVRMLRDLVLSEKEQRDSVWRTSSEVPGNATNATPNPVSSAFTASVSSVPSAAPVSKPSVVDKAKQSATDAVAMSLIAAASKPEPMQRDSELQRQRQELQRQVQARRESRELEKQAERLRTLKREAAPGVDVLFGDAVQDMRNFHAHTAKQPANKPEASARRFNPDSIMSRDSFLTPDSRGHKDYVIRDGTVSSYTRGDSVPADHLWLDSSTNSKQ